MTTVSETPTSRSVAGDEATLASLQASTSTFAPGTATNSSITATLPAPAATTSDRLPWPYYQYSDSNGHSWTVADPNSSVSYVNRTSVGFEDSCNTESGTATGLDQQVISVPVGASAGVLVNSADNFQLFLAAPHGITFNVTYFYTENNDGPAEYEQFNVTVTVNSTAQIAHSLLPCGLQLTRSDLTSDPNITISTVSVTPISSTEVLYVLNMTLATDPSANNGSSFAGLTGVDTGSTSQPAPESSGFPIIFVVIPLTIVGVILLAGLAWFLLRRRRRRRAAGGKLSQKRYTALSDLSNSSVALSRTAATDSRRTSATLAIAPPSVTAHSVDPFEDGYQASEFIRSSSHEPSSPSHSYATLDPALGRRQSLQSSSNSYSTFSHPDMARRPGSDLSHGFGSYTMRDSLASEGPFADTVSDSGTVVSTKGLVRDKG